MTNITTFATDIQNIVLPKNIGINTKEKTRLILKNINLVFYILDFIKPLHIDIDGNINTLYIKTNLIYLIINNSHINKIIMDIDVLKIYGNNIPTNYYGRYFQSLDEIITSNKLKQCKKCNKYSYNFFNTQITKGKHLLYKSCC